ncbi:transporter substrate-binding domain-containing protein [Devosia albogilva]|uniref:Transporter substrate-binding domain-containing protein n=1 Tax=Devosia albogilva TaxID=429726 RepID=A0ABW5QI00_9HYPH
MPQSRFRISVLSLASAGVLLFGGALVPGVATAQTPSGADCIDVPDTSLIKPGTLTVVTNAASYPNSYVDADGKIVGVRAEMSQMIADELCLDLEMINAPFDGHIPGLQSQRWDISASGMVYTPERVEVVKMIPVEVQGVVIWVTGDNPRNIETVGDLAGLRVATEGPGYEFDATNKLSEGLAAEGKEPFEVLVFGDNTKAAQALAAGQAEALITTGLPPSDGRFIVAGKPLNQTFKCLGFNDQALADAVVQVVKRLREDGRLAELLARYNFTMYEGETKVLTPDSPPEEA